MIVDDQPKQKSGGKTICIDFDGVIHTYDGWQEGQPLGTPIEGAVEGINRLIKRGYQIVVLTARDEIQEVQDWLDKHDILARATNIKPRAIAYIDDRGIRFVSWKDLLNYF